MQSLLSKYNVSQESLRQPCDDKLFSILMGKITSFEDTAPCFGLPSPEIQKIRSDNPTENSRTYSMLCTWRYRNGCDATYLAIVNIFHKMENQILVETILKYIIDPDSFDILANCKSNISMDSTDSESTISCQSFASVSTYEHEKKWYEMTVIEKKHIKRTLWRENDRIRQKYVTLTFGISESFQKHNVHFNSLKSFVIFYSSQSPPGETATNISCQLDGVTDIAGVFQILFTRKLSWLNVKLLTVIVNKFGSDEVKRRMKAYKADKLIPYLRQSIFEIPSISSHHAKPGHTPFLLLPGDPIGGQKLEFIKAYLFELLGITDTHVWFINYGDAEILEMGITKPTENDATKESFDMKDSELEILKTELKLKTQQLEENLSLVEDQAEEITRLRENLQNAREQTLREDHHTLQQDYHTLQRDHHTLQQECQKQKQAVRIDHQQLQIVLEKSEQDHHSMQQEYQKLQQDHKKEQRDHLQLQAVLEQKEREHQNEKAHQIRKLQESWKVSHKDVKITQEELGRGGWGVIQVGLFREQRVAVKQLYSVIMSEDNLALMHREINTMSKLRHPNLLLFIGAVLDHPYGSPLIITEIMDASLRDVYKRNQLTSEMMKLTILRDVAAGLNYLHCLDDPIIHRDVSSANVLLESKGPDRWKAKLSDFGSANIARNANTKHPGAAFYGAPECFQIAGRVRKKQTTMMDVFSFGVLLCEIMTCRFPDPDQFLVLLKTVDTSSPPIAQLIRTCIEEEAENRPTIRTVIQQLDERVKLLTK